jgi:uncharacterized membrane protein
MANHSILLCLSFQVRFHNFNSVVIFVVVVVVVDIVVAVLEAVEPPHEAFSVLTNTKISTTVNNTDQ